MTVAPVEVAFNAAARRRRQAPRRRGTFVCLPFHSTANPPVGLAYLRAYLGDHGVVSGIDDLNIATRDVLRRCRPPDITSQVWLQEVDGLFLQSRRSYLGEALCWSWFDAGGAAAVVRRALEHPSPLIRRFWEGAGIERIVDDPVIVALGAHLEQILTFEISRIAEREVDFFGLTLTVGNQAASFYAARLLRARRPDALIVAGGPHVNPRNAAGLLAACPCFDAAIAAPAFRPMLELLETGGDSAPAGVVRRMPDGSTVSGGVARDVELDDMPGPDWSGVDLHRYAPSFDVPTAWGRTDVDRRTLPMQTSRGCSYSKCEFCHNVVDYPRLVARSPELLLADVERLHDELGVVNFFFTDDEFNGSRRRTKDIAAALASGPDIRFFAWLRLDKIDEGQLEALYAAGCRQVFIGVEGIDDHVLALLHKGYSADVAIDRLRRLHRFTRDHPDFTYFYNLIIDHPAEQMGSVDRTRATIEREPELFVGRVAALCRYHLYEGTPAFGRFGEGAPGVLEPLVPPDVTVDSFRYLPLSQDRPDSADRLAKWRAIGHLLSDERRAGTLHSVDQSIYD